MPGTAASLRIWQNPRCSRRGNPIVRRHTLRSGRATKRLKMSFSWANAGLFVSDILPLGKVFPWGETRAISGHDFYSTIHSTFRFGLRAYLACIVGHVFHGDRG